MTTDEFSTWMQGRGLSDIRAGALLGASRVEVWRWRTGKRSVPNRVALLAALLDDLAEASPASDA